MTHNKILDYSYLEFLEEEIRIDGKDVRMTGSYAVVANPLQQTALGIRIGVPRTGSMWLPKPDLNKE